MPWLGHWSVSFYFELQFFFFSFLFFEPYLFYVCSLRGQNGVSYSIKLELNTVVSNLVGAENLPLQKQ